MSVHRLSCNQLCTWRPNVYLSAYFTFGRGCSNDLHLVEIVGLKRAPRRVIKNSPFRRLDTMYQRNYEEFVVN